MKPIKVLFVCHGNICRSPMAEFIFKNMIDAAGAGSQFEVASAATSREEIGNDIYPPTKEILRKHCIPFDKRKAGQVTDADMDYYDFIIVMDQNNLRYLSRMFPGRSMEKVHLLMSFAGQARDVADPWYTRNFQDAYEDIEEGCRGLLKEVL